MSEGILCRCSDLLPQSKEIHTGTRLIVDSKLSIGVPVGLNGCLSLYVGPLMDCPPGCAPPLAQCQLGLAAGPPRTLKRISTIYDGQTALFNCCVHFRPLSWCNMGKTWSDLTSNEFISFLSKSPHFPYFKLWCHSPALCVPTIHLRPSGPLIVHHSLKKITILNLIYPWIIIAITT